MLYYYIDYQGELRVPLTAVKRSFFQRVVLSSLKTEKGMKQPRHLSLF